MATLGGAFFLLAVWPDESMAAAGSTPFDPGPARHSVRQWLQATSAAYEGAPDTTAGPARVALRRVEGLLAEAERITAVEADTGRAGRSPGRVEEVWHRATRATFESARDLKAHRSRAFERWAVLRERLTVEVDDAKRLLASGGGLGYREARAMRAAIYHRDAALRLASVHDYGRAADAAEQALALTTQVESGFESLHLRFRDARRLRQWRTWAEETVAASKSSGGTAIVVDKLGRRLKVYDGGRLVATFHAELGANGLKEKRHAGDKATPEGRYRVTEARQNGATRYYKALLLDYPNVHDRARFASDQRLGLVPARAGLGGLIEIHGEGGAGKDWTDGCVALRNSDMDSLFRWSRVGTPVTIVGTL